ncbi:hypothetical protein KSP39_PZI000741 [Platanthera zijinensis]|uniref:Uncharacterized protein n=1 Tax=Platanthera zijinensis TaxID=2320716 RepID=A0AAP0C1W8_9ASPA
MHPKQINEIKDFLLITLRKDARSMKDQEEQGSCEVQVMPNPVKAENISCILLIITI